MADPAEQPEDTSDGASNTNGPGDNGEVPDGDDADLQRAHEIGTAMIEQLGVLLDRWLVQISELVERDIDPAPLLSGLARLMRSAADQLDPETETPDTESTESE